MPVTRQFLIILAAGGSLALLAAAFFFQALGWAPCAMCLWQRWPHAAAVVFGGAALAISGPMMPLLGGLSALTTAGIGVYHSGVERKWWAGPDSCTGGSEDLGGLGGDALLPGASEGPALVLCDSFEPFLFGLTMANYNAFASLGLAVIWAMAALKRD
ncbi:disulfide bond formation protein B [Primorskyibacter aestuariivivens]|uniref:disulfide bond formation protein B n=1 Tax=Primorskyibacter aestuariivivens TaxID=1888912 RepID=UPI0022FFF046|nr:disulfide bond formation protein B [Primorskyibacter aestuariivivens]MDA7429846.1 disulfide bond formation protein B [Primorskyibacter aestuariivivens]